MDLEVIRYVQQTLFRVYMSTKKEIKEKKNIRTTFTKSLKKEKGCTIYIFSIMIYEYYDAHSMSI